MNITKVTFLPKNKKCLSLLNVDIYVNQSNFSIAAKIASEKFKNENDNYRLYNRVICQSVEVI
jgi:hypothetical protein